MTRRDAGDSWLTRGTLPLLAVAAAIVLCGLLAIALVPREAPAPPQVRTATRLTAMRVIERPSPIVAADGTLLQSLGIENAGDRFLPLIPSGTRAPASAMLTFATAPERPDEVRFHLLRGTGERPAENHSLGRFRVTNLPPGGPGTPRALLILRVVDGAVQAAAVDPRTGAPLTLDEVAAASGP